MKQTNSALKFLLAQYRAIFKHAQLASILAIAAAAGLSVGQANAAGIASWTDLSEQSPTLDGTEATKTLEIVGADGKMENTKGFDITLTANPNGSTHSIKGTAAVAPAPGNPGTPGTPAYNDFTTGKDAVTSITISGDGTAVANPTLEIGGAADGTNARVSISNLKVIAGTLKINDGKDADNASSFTAKTIQIGGTAANGAAVRAKDAAIVDLGKNASIGSAITTSFDIQEGGTLKFSGAGSKASAAEAINLAGGDISVADGASGTIDSKLNATAGTVTVGGGKDGSLIVAKDAQFTGGVLDVASGGTVTFNGTANFGKASFKNAGSVVVKGNTTIADDAIEANGIGASGTLTIGYNGTSSTKLTVNAENLKTLTKATDNKIIASGDSLGADPLTFAEIHFTDDTIDLGTSNGVGVLADAGTAGTKLDAQNGRFKFSGQEATFAGATINDKSAFEFKSLKAGTEQDGLTVSGGAQISVSEQLNVADGKGALTIDSGSVVLSGSADGAISAKSVTLAATGADTSGAALRVNQGSWNVASLTVTKGTADVDKSTLKVSGDLVVTEGSVNLTDNAFLKVGGKVSTAGDNGKITADFSTIDTIGGGALALSGQGIELMNNATLLLEKADVLKEDGGKLVLDESKYAQNAVSGEGNTIIKIMDGDKKLSMKAAEFTAFQEKTGFKGLFEIELTDLTGDAKPVEGMNLDNVVGNASTEAYNDIGVTITDGSKSVDKVASVGNIKIENEQNLTMGEGGALTLNKPSGGMFVSKKSGDGVAVADVAFNGTDNALTLGGTGEIGAISNGGNTPQGRLTIGSKSASGKVSVKGDIGAAANNKQISSVTVNSSNSLVVSGSVYTNTLDLKKDAALDAGKGAVVVHDSASIMGDVTAGELNLAGGATERHTIAGNASVDVTTLKLAASSDLFVGQDSIPDQRESSSAEVFVTNLDLGAGAKIFVDPDYSDQAALFATQELRNDTGNDVGVLQGAIFVGQNAAFGYGFDEAEFKSVMSNYLNSKVAFDKPGEGAIQNAFVVNKPLKISTHAGIIVDPNLKEKDVTNTLLSSIADKLLISSGSSLILTDKAFGDDKKSAAITFGDGASVNGYTATVTADAGSVISLFGEFTAKDTDVKFFDTTPVSGQQVSLSLTNDVLVTALGGMLEGTLKASDNGTLKSLKVSNDAKKIAYDGVSTSVGDLFMEVVRGDYDGSTEFGYEFVFKSMGLKQFKAVDAAAHAATYAGAQQAAVAAVTTMADAVVGRVGSMGVEANTITATGSQANGGVWLTPMYKSVDADGFNAQGASYGADIDLAGVAFGADTVNGNMRFGAVFNIGSGDADGKGNGNGLKDEFDYYGFGIYSVMGFGNLALVGDASLNVISHDVEGLGLKGSADTTAVTMGVTAQYTFSTPAVDVVPHLGMRFTRLDTDSYDLSSAKGVIANTEFDVQNVISIPLGVTLSKAFEMGGWALAPSADLSINFNTGDTEAESSTYFTGTRAINLSTEVLDEVTYGVAVGLGAQYGAFGTNIGLNYTGSENTDSFGVNAQARYMF